jgi:hypothetical protein
MKNEAALKSMAKMIQAMLPYEPEYKPTSLGTLCLSEMFEGLKVRSPQIVEFEGVFNYLLKGMDIKNDSNSGPKDTGHSQDVNALDDFLVELRDIMINSYPVDEDAD